MRLSTDGKFYELEQLVRANCQDCVGCHDCCVGMGDTILLDPYDVWMLKRAASLSMQEMLSRGLIALKVADGLVLPYIQMNSKTDECPFLNVEKRCSIHANRPGMCRLFPLGRNYEDGKLNYILLTEACRKKNRSKIKVGQWIGIQPERAYHDYVLAWHGFRKYISKLCEEAAEEEMKKLAMYVLQEFYISLQAPEDVFFDRIIQKLEHVEKTLGVKE